LFDQSQNRSRKIGGKVSYERALPGIPGLTAIAGVDALIDRTEQRLIATGRTWVPPTEFRSLAPFGQLNLALLDGKLRLAGGARWENVKITIDDFTTLFSAGAKQVAGGSPTFSDVLFNGGVVVEPAPGIRTYASYAEGYTVPDVGRITRAINRDGVDIDNFLDISPIVSNNREVGVEAKRGPLDASVAYFWSSSDKGQLLVLNGGVFDVQRLRVQIQGLEVNLGVETPIPGLRVSAGYAHIDGRYDSDTPPDGKVDTDLDGANISPDRLNLAANYARGPFTARLQTQFYLSRSFTGKVRVPENDFAGYTIADAYLGYDTGLGRLTLAVQNLFDRQYIDYSSDTTRAGDRSRFFAGRGRTFTLGWDYRF
jgi:iron complex outermembrane receptor protein